MVTMMVHQEKNNDENVELGKGKAPNTQRINRTGR
jgi:hypothetical protein